MVHITWIPLLNLPLVITIYNFIISHFISLEFLFILLETERSNSLKFAANELSKWRVRDTYSCFLLHCILPTTKERFIYIAEQFNLLIETVLNIVYFWCLFEFYIVLLLYSSPKPAYNIMLRLGCGLR